MHFLLIAEANVLKVVEPLIKRKVKLSTVTSFTDISTFTVSMETIKDVDRVIALVSREQASADYILTFHEMVSNTYPLARVLIVLKDDETTALDVANNIVSPYTAVLMPQNINSSMIIEWATLDINAIQEKYGVKKTNLEANIMADDMQQETVSITSKAVETTQPSNPKPQKKKGFFSLFRKKSVEEPPQQEQPNGIGVEEVSVPQEEDYNDHPIETEQSSLPIQEDLNLDRLINRQPIKQPEPEEHYEESEEILEDNDTPPVMVSPSPVSLGGLSLDDLDEDNEPPVVPPKVEQPSVQPTVQSVPQPVIQPIVEQPKVQPVVEEPKPSVNLIPQVGVKEETVGVFDIPSVTVPQPKEEVIVKVAPPKPQVTQVPLPTITTPDPFLEEVESLLKTTAPSITEPVEQLGETIQSVITQAENIDVFKELPSTVKTVTGEFKATKVENVKTVEGSELQVEDLLTQPTRVVEQPQANTALDTTKTSRIIKKVAKERSYFIITGERFTGKTTTAIHLASTLRQTRTTLFVDFDDRKGSLFHFGLEKVAVNLDGIVGEGVARYRTPDLLQHITFMNYETGFDCLLNGFETTLEDEHIKHAQALLVNQTLYEAVVIDCPIEKLSLLTEIIPFSTIMFCVNPSLNVLYSTFYSLEKIALDNNLLAQQIAMNMEFIVFNTQDGSDFLQTVADIKHYFESEQGIDWLNTKASLATNARNYFAQL